MRRLCPLYALLVRLRKTVRGAQEGPGCGGQGLAIHSDRSESAANPPGSMHFPDS